VQLPIHGYLVKPVNERDLAAAIGVAVARFEEAQAAARENAELRNSLEARKIVERAKGVLIKTGVSEEEAYLTIQRRAREAHQTMRQVSEAILAQNESASP
jgi:response regulator NasT